MGETAAKEPEERMLGFLQRRMRITEDAGGEKKQLYFQVCNQSASLSGTAFNSLCLTPCISCAAIQ